MSSKNNAQVIIAGKVFTLCGYESQEYLQRVASYINGKMDECNQMNTYRMQSSDNKALLMYLNLADDYFKAKDQAALVEEELENKDKEVYDLKHEIISAKLKVEALERQVQTLSEEKNELEKKILQLEVQNKNRQVSLGMAEPSSKTNSSAEETEQKGSKNAHGTRSRQKAGRTE